MKVKDKKAKTIFEKLESKQLKQLNHKKILYEKF